MKSAFKTFYHQVSDYNLFIPDEHDYDDEPQDPRIALKHQKYTTRLYVLLLGVCMYILFYVTIMNSQAHTIVITDIDVKKFESLYSEHGETLSCPCSTITAPYQQFVSNVIRIHPVCTSFFISQQWIEALYIPNRTLYIINDFRKTASSQFQLLSSLCSLSQDITLENEKNINNTEFVTVSLLPELKVQLEINATVQLFKSTLSTRILSFIDYYRIIIQANGFVTAHGTNAMVLYANLSSYGAEGLFSMTTFYVEANNDNTVTYISYCIADRVVTRTGIYSYDFGGGIALTSWSNLIDSTAYKVDFINGFFTGCTPFESLLQATLDCLYEIDCLQLLNDYFPSLTQMNLDLSDYVLLANKTNHTIYNHLLNLFIEEWTTTLNYSAYLQNCNPSVCTYTTTNKINYSYAITLFISLYGGLILILRFISSFLINILLKLKSQSIYKLSIINQQNVIQRIKQFNLFKRVHQRTENDIKEQKLTTRIYLFLLLSMIIVLLLFNSLNTQIVTISIENPSLSTYINLQRKYSHTLTCPCSTVTISYQKFMSFSPILHQICSSDFIKDEWISSLEDCTIQYLDIDWRNRAFQQFRLLSKLCQLANETITVAIYEFLLQPFVVSNVLTENDFNIQIEKVLNQFNQSTIIYFSHLIDAVNLYIRIDQPFMVRFTTYGSINLAHVNTDSIQPIQDNTTDNQTLMEATLSLMSLHDVNSNTSQCFCFADSDCKTSSIIFYIDFTLITIEFTSDRVSYVIPGSNRGCSEIDSLLLSTFECFYSDSVCYQTVRNYLQHLYVWNINTLSQLTNVMNPKNFSWFNAKPLIYNSTLNHFSRDTPISTIIKSLFLEQWNPFYSYNEFYQLCSPKYCTYQERIQKNNIIGIIVTLISTIGGLAVSLRFITPYLVKLIMQLIAIILRKQQQHQQRLIVPTWSQRFKLLKQRIIRALHESFISLNIFPRRVFGNDTDQTSVKYYGKLATRLYFTLLIISFIILTLYTIAQQQMMTKEFYKPSFKTYNELIQTYGNQLKCSCSSISSSYGQFIGIQPIFHEICLSAFASNEMINNLAVSLSSNISIYDKRDYRRWIISHMQYLRGLCQISIQSIENSIDQLLSTLLISKDLLFESDFDQHIDTLVEQTKQNAPDNLNAIFFLIRNINFGNAILSTYGTNFKYIVNWVEESDLVFYAETEIYDNNCSCALHMNCTSEAYFIDDNSLEKVPITGLKIGCTPTESFLSSTLECFYDSLCVNIIKEYTNYSSTLESLSNQSSIDNMTIGELVQNLFINQWSTTKSYSSYYQQCAPLLCSYTYIQRINLIYIASFLFGLQGGLTIVLQWICPRIIQFIITIKRNRNKRSNTVHPKPDVEIVSTTNQLEVTTTYGTSQYLKIILSCFLIVEFIVLVILSSIYIIQRANHQTTSAMISSTDSAMNIDVTTVSISTSTSSKVSGCHFKFETIPISMPDSYSNASGTVAGDFNNDNRLDIVYMFNDYYAVLYNCINTITTMIVLLRNEDNTFEQPIVSSLSSMHFFNVLFCTSIDFNHDGLLDIVVLDNCLPSVRVYLGNGDGTFHELIFLLSNCTTAISLSIGNLNNDEFLDFAVLCSFSSNSINVIFGNVDETFTPNTIVNDLLGTLVMLMSVKIADLNGDNYEDIVAVNQAEFGIDVFIGYGNGTFDKQKISLFGKGGSTILASIGVGDFNEDMIQDVIFLYVSGTYQVGLAFGYNDGTFSPPIKLNLKIEFMLSYPLIITDFNNDGLLDIVTTTYNPSTLNIYFGDGNGNFELYTAFSSEALNYYTYIATVNFNDDNHPDIFIASTLGVYIFLNTGQCDNNMSDIFETSTSIYN